jgi:hypothetical protein
VQTCCPATNSNWYPPSRVLVARVLAAMGMGLLFAGGIIVLVCASRTVKSLQDVTGVLVDAV